VSQKKAGRSLERMMELKMIGKLGPPCLNCSCGHALHCHGHAIAWALFQAHTLLVIPRDTSTGLPLVPLMSELKGHSSSFIQPNIPHSFDLVKSEQERHFITQHSLQKHPSQHPQSLPSIILPSNVIAPWIPNIWLFSMACFMF